MIELPPIERFVASNGARVYRIPCQAFPNLFPRVALVLDAGPPTLIDTGSGFDQCTTQILDGLRAVRTEFGEPIDVADIKRILITHGHIDHFGGLGQILEQTDARVGIHGLDRRVITAYEERVVVASKELHAFLQQAGVKPALQTDLMGIYTFFKKQRSSTQVDFRLEDEQEFDGFRIIHTPGHCPGQICIGVGNILFSSDHILPQTTPHQAPESITPFTGVAHYLQSLDKIRKMQGFDLALGGHEEPMHDLYARIDDIRQDHLRKLDQVRAIIKQADTPPTVSDVSKTMYPDVQSFHILLALEEAGAHVEYLYQHGELAVENLDEVESEPNPPLRYRLA